MTPQEQALADHQVLPPVIRDFEVTFKNSKYPTIIVKALAFKLDHPFWCFYAATHIGGLVAAYNADDVASIRNLTDQAVSQLPARMPQDGKPYKRELGPTGQNGPGPCPSGEPGPEGQPGQS